MVHTLFLLLAPSFQAVPTDGRTPSRLTSSRIAAEVGRVRRFARLVATDHEGATDPKILGDGKPLRTPSWDIRGMRAYKAGAMYLWVDPVSCLVNALEGGSDHSLDRMSRPRRDASGTLGLMPVARRISDEEAGALAARYFAATGRAYTVQVIDLRDG